MINSSLIYEKVKLHEYFLYLIRLKNRRLQRFNIRSIVNYLYLESLKITKSGCSGFQFVLNLQLSF